MAIKIAVTTMEARRGTEEDSAEEVVAFLNSSPECDSGRVDIRSLFSLVRAALSRLEARFVLGEKELHLKNGDRLLDGRKRRET